MNANSSEPAANLETIYSAKNEMEATVVVNTLRDAGIQAMMQGQHTGSFRAENWTDVIVVVRKQDAEAAKRAITAMEPMDEDIDWDQVDVGQPEE